MVQTNANATEWAITLKTDVITLFVWLDAGVVSGRFSENGFLQVEVQKTVIFYADVATTAQILTDNLSVTNLLDDRFL